MGNKEKKIILFDGVCNLCNNTVNFIIKKDKNSVFRYASLQSEIGRKIALKNGVDISQMDTFLLVDTKGCYNKSTAALHIAKHLSGGYPLLSILLIVPKPFRDWIYSIISRNRYKWFGKQNSCLIPTPELASLFID